MSVQIVYHKLSDSITNHVIIVLVKNCLWRVNNCSYMIVVSKIAVYHKLCDSCISETLAITNYVIVVLIIAIYHKLCDSNVRDRLTIMNYVIVVSITVAYHELCDNSVSDKFASTSYVSDSYVIGSVTVWPSRIMW